MLYIKNVRDNNGDCSVFFNTGFCSETSVLSQVCHVLCTIWMCLIHMSGYITYQEGRRGKGDHLSAWNDTLSPLYVTHRHTPDGGRELGGVATCRDVVEATAAPLVPRRCSLQSHQDLGAELTPPEGKDQGSRKNRTDCVQMSNFPFHYALGITDNISQQIIKCTEVCFFPSSS